VCRGDGDFDQFLEVQFTSELASRMVNRMAKVLNDPDATGTAVINATGAVAALTATFRGFDNRL
jgi:hypothetical protein